MYPHQKYPSVYRTDSSHSINSSNPHFQQYPHHIHLQQQQQQPPPPQSPFDVAYGSSLLPRQLLISSPFVQVPSPLPSPIHHPHYGSNNGAGNYFSRSASSAALSQQQQYSQGGNGYVLVSPPAPKLSLPPKRFRSKIDQTTPSKQSKSKNTTQTTTASNSDLLSSNSASSIAEDDGSLEFGQDPAYPIEISKDSITNQPFPLQHQPSLNRLYTSNNSSTSNTTSSSSSFQFSRSPTRSIILLKIDQNVSLQEFLDLITYGPLESVQLLENYPSSKHNSIVLNFLKTETCLNFFNSLLTYLSKFQDLIKSSDLSIQFLTSKKILPFISYAINNDGATRNVYIGNLNTLSKEVDEEFLFKEFSRFGLIEKIDVIEKKKSKPDLKHKDELENVNDDDNDKDNGINEVEEDTEKYAFIHFLNIASAIKAVEQISLDPIWETTKIFYGTDRCSKENNNLLKSLIDEVPSPELTNDYLENDGLHDVDHVYDREDDVINEENEEEDVGYFSESDVTNNSTVQYLYPYQSPQLLQYQTPLSNGNLQYRNFYEAERATNQNYNTMLYLASMSGGQQNIGNRTICLSNVDPKTKPEEICNIVRGGILQAIKLLSEKKVCFLTFVEQTAATQFFANNQINPLTLHGRRLKVGWGSHSGPLPNQISLAVTIGASRNVYIGFFDDDDQSKDSELNSKDTSNLSLPDEEELRKDFEKFGEIEQINYWKNGRCVFLNFWNISNAIKLVNDANGNKSEEFHEYYAQKYKHLKISYGKDRCGNPPKPKKSSKRRNKRNLKESNKEFDDEIVTRKELAKIDENDNNEVQEVPIELFASMGISTKTNSDVTKDESLPIVDSSAVSAFGISQPITTQNFVKDDVEQSVADEKSSVEVDVTANETKDETKEEEHDDYNENDDGISVSSSSDLDVIVSSRSDSLTKHTSTSTTSSKVNVPYTPSNHEFKRQSSSSHLKRYQKPYSRNSSRVSSQVSLNSYYNEAQQPYYQDYYKAVPFAPPPQIPLNYQQGHRQHSNASRTVPHPSYHQGGHNTTNGLQVMAQYLQQSQHANLLYAANVLNTDPIENGEGYDYYQSGYFPPQRKSKRRG